MKRFCIVVALISLLVSCQQKELITPKEEVVPVTRVVLSQTKAEMYVGDDLTLTATVQPENATNKEVEWKSSNYDIVNVDSAGQVSAMAEGTARITATCGNRKGICTITVLVPEVPAVHVTGISLNKTSETLEKGETLKLTPTITPEDATNKRVNWQSSKASVATVEDGLVTAVGYGEATITVTTLDGGFKATCAITVPKPEITPGEDPENDDPTGTKGVGEFPSVHIDIRQRDVDRNSYKETIITFKDPDSWYTSVPELTLTTKIRGRGNMSWGLSKKPFRLKFTDESGAHRVFGMNRNKDWDLIANHNDHILLRNSIGYHISKKMGFDWTPKYRFVELYLNGEYWGNYILVQHKEVASEKVNITPATEDTKPEDGGYYLEVEDKNGNGDYTSSIYKMPWWWNDPETPTQAQKDYLIGIFENIDTGLKNGDFTKVWDNLEMGPMVDYFILKELSKDIDGCLRKSNYFSKAPGTKLRMCHVWDFDLAFGNCCDITYDGHEYLGGATGWFIKEVGGNFYLYGNNYGKGKGWYPAMFQDPNFVAAVKARWAQVYPMLQEVPAWVDEQIGYYRKGFDHNFTKWSIRENNINRTIEGSYDGEVKAFKEWYGTRLEWMNTEISKW